MESGGLYDVKISIHVPREGDDCIALNVRLNDIDFNPRPP